jgi:hypothetical protein
MNDVVGQIVIAVSDENLGAFDGICAVAARFRPGAQQAKIGAGLRLGQVHGAGPCPGHHVGQKPGFDVFGAMGLDGVDRALGQGRADAERHGGGIEHFGNCDIEGKGQALAAQSLGRVKPIPAGLDPLRISLAPAIRRLDIAVFEPRALFVAGLVQGSDHLGSKLAGFLQYRIHGVAVEIAERAGIERFAKPGHVVKHMGQSPGLRLIGRHLLVSHGGWLRSPLDVMRRPGPYRRVRIG